MVKKQKILVSGASSTFMSILINLIDKNKYSIIAITRDKSRIKIPNIDIVEGDILHKDFINSITKDIQIIIHAAGITHTQNQAEYWKINVQGTCNFVNGARINKVKKFIYISSRSASNESGAYGFSKLKAEEYVIKNHKNWIIFRIAEVFGGNKNVGIDNLIETVSNKKIVFYPSGLHDKLYPISSNDTAKLIYNYLFIDDLSNKSIIINGNIGYNYYDLIKIICKSLSKRPIIVPIPKIFMFILKWLIERFKLNIGIVADQIPRLYSKKEKHIIDFKFHTFENYLIKKID